MSELMEEIIQMKETKEDLAKTVTSDYEEFQPPNDS